MKKGKNYRYSLQFDDSTEEHRLVGEFLEQLGNKKSTVIVQAMLQYLENHPEALKGKEKIKIQIKTIPDWLEIERKIHSIINERISSMQVNDSLEQTDVSHQIAEELDTDIDEMLLNLELFDQ